MNVLLISDIHENYENVIKVNKIKRDMTIICGDFTNGGGAEKVKRMLAMLDGPKLAVPGNMDNWDVIDILEKEDISIHRRVKNIDNLKVGGFGGGGYGPFGTPLEFSELEFDKELKNLGKVDILVTHMPAKDTKVDAGYGSSAIREYIEKTQPKFAFSGHIHEARGIDNIGKSTLVNPGPLKYGYYSLVNTETGKIEMQRL